MNPSGFPGAPSDTAPPESLKSERPNPAEPATLLGRMATNAQEMTNQDASHPHVAREWLRSMILIRRFEERAGEMYAKAKVGGFLHLAIGEEATIVGAVQAMRDEDYLISTYRSHGHALARGSDPNKVMAELFGREEGVSGGRGGSMHMFDLERRFKIGRASCWVRR